MAIGVDNTSYATISNSVVQGQHICTGTESNGILIVTVQVTDSVLGDRTISGVTHNEQALTHLVQSDTDDTDDGIRTEIWYRINPDTGGTPDIVVTAGGKCIDLSYGAISLTGIDSTNFNSLMDKKFGFSLTGTVLNVVTTAVGHSFTGDGNTINGIGLLTRYNGSPTGNVYVKIYAHSGIFGISSVPTGPALATSVPISAADLVKKYNVYVEFEISYTTINGTKYVAVIEYTNGDAIDNIVIRNISDSHDGNYSVYTTSWAADSTKDLLFFINKGTSKISNETYKNTPPTLDIITVGDSSYVIDSLASGEADGIKIVEAHTAIHKTDVGADTHASQYVDAGGAGAQTMNYSDTDADTRWVMSAVAVMEAVVGEVIKKIVSEVLNSVEAENYKRSRHKIVNNVLNLVEAKNKLRILRRIKNEVTNLVEDKIRLRVMIRIKNEVENLVEAKNYIRGRLKVISEVLSLTELKNKVKGIVKIASEVLNLSELRNYLQSKFRVTSETLNVVEAFNKLRILKRIVGEVLNISEAKNYIRGRLRVFSETVNLGELKNYIRGRFKVVNEVVSIIESTFHKIVLAALEIIKVINESMQISVVKNRLLTRLRVIDEALTIAEQKVRALILIKIVNESINVIENTVRRVVSEIEHIIRIVNETMNVGEIVSRSKTLLRTIDNIVSIPEISIKVRRIVKVLKENIRITEVFTWLMVLFKAIRYVFTVAKKVPLKVSRILGDFAVTKVTIRAIGAKMRLFKVPSKTKEFRKE